MKTSANPFQELYVTDSANPAVFVNLFSDLHIPDALPLFSPGNVVVKGTQGSGKSMLLNLLKPEIRVAYAEAGKTFPVPQRLHKFISAGINFTRSGILDLGQRPLGGQFGQEDRFEFPLLFADFLNYWVVRDLLESVEKVARYPVVFANLVNPANLDAFAKALGSEDCWFGYLDGVDTFDGLMERIDARIRQYRSFMNFNSSLGDEVRSTKTTVAEPIARAADDLKLYKVVPPKTEIKIRLDQVERLTTSDAVRPELGREYRRILNKALSLRDNRISYNLGTRRHAWEDDLKIYASEDKVENLRDYRVVDLDSVLLRREDRRGWLFPKFAADAFRKRIQYANMSVSPTRDLIADVFKGRYVYESAARDYAKNADPHRVLGLSDETPQAWKDFLLRAFKENPFEAFVAASWARQGGAKKSRLEQPPPVAKKPWSSQWWLKERTRQALIQLAGRCAQKLRWSGKDQVLALSSGNISIFLSICHECWDVYQRSLRVDDDTAGTPLEEGMERQVQSVGIYNACDYWYQKITERPRGDNRKKFVDFLGRQFRDWLTEDVPMSYPGWNGFSVDENELRDAPTVGNFLNDLVDYGELVRMPHTPKTKGMGKRVKFYLSPILSPQYQIPETRVKEPYYAEVNEVAGWIRTAGVTLEGFAETRSAPPVAKKAADEQQMRLF